MNIPTIEHILRTYAAAKSAEDDHSIESTEYHYMAASIALAEHVDRAKGNPNPLPLGEVAALFNKTLAEAWDKGRAEGVTNGAFPKNRNPYREKS